MADTAGTSTSEENVGTAFALVAIAGLSTTLGAAFVCIPGFARYATPALLARSLAFSAGVMVYISFAEILQKSIKKFMEAGHKESVAHAYSSLCFFLGIGATVVRSALLIHQLLFICNAHVI